MKTDILAMASSPYSIFLNADAVVKTVIVLLLLASLVSWTIIFNRAWAISVERRRAAAAARAIGSVSTVDELGRLCEMIEGRVHPLLVAIEGEWRWSNENVRGAYDMMKARILSTAELVIAREGAGLTGKTSILATIGSISPFVGLFGTVWGIMASFMAIGQSQDTSLAVVAPGIAEALMATAVGLFCAIPAVIGYNRLLQSLGETDMSWRTIAGELEVSISRTYDSKR